MGLGGGGVVAPRGAHGAASVRGGVARGARGVAWAGGVFLGGAESLGRVR